MLEFRMLATDRRLFLNKTIKLGCFSLLAGVVPALEAEPSSQQTGLLAKMQWINAPTTSRIEGDKLIVRSSPKGDFFRMPGFVADNGNFFRMPAEGNFVFEARIEGQYSFQYDQAGLMLRQDTENWLKCGTEVVDGKRYAAVVLTRQWSDGSMMQDLTESAPVWWRIVRKKDSVETLCSLDGKSFTSVREAFGYFASALKLEIGIYCAAPEGQGVQATFDSVKLSAL
jgi:uncharacterized protein